MGFLASLLTCAERYGKINTVLNIVHIYELQRRDCL